MNGKWHIVALAVCVSICTKVFATYAFTIAYIIWLIWLFHTERLKQGHVILAILFYVITLLLIPSIDPIATLNKSVLTEKVTGTIVRPINKKEHVIESVLQDDDSDARILLTYFPKEPQEASLMELPHGSTCIVTGEAKVVDAARNPGQFDFRNYLSTQGISHQIIINDQSDIICSGQSLLHHVHELRDLFVTFVGEEVDPFIGSWIRALIFGDTSALDSEVIEVFQRWGLSHILAISGLHVGLIVGLLYALLVKSGWVTKETASYILLGFIPLYIVIAGGEPSVLRAGLMVFLFLVVQTWFQKISTIDGLSIVFICLVCLDPYIVYHIGFQFSFITTIALLLSTKWLAQTTSTVWNVAHISLIAQLSILPLQLNAFHIFQPLSIGLNIIVVSYFSLLIIPFLFIYILMFPLVSPLMQLFDSLFIYVHTFVLDAIVHIDQLNIPQMVVGAIPLPVSILYYVVFIAMMVFLESRLLKQAFLTGVFLVCTLVSVQLFPYLSKEGCVTMLDIGQGDAIVIELPYRKGVLMFDAGAMFSFKDQTISEKEYTQIIKPYLYSRGIQKVDALMISHAHLDHNGSAPFIMDEFRVDDYIVSEFYELNKAEEHILEANHIELHRLKTFDEITIMDQHFTVVSPDKDYHDKNENSLAVVTQLGEEHWIFTGDMYKKQEKRMRQSFPDLPIDIWKVAHHGSDTSSDKDTIDHYDPDVFLIPVGVNNSHEHPNDEVIEMLDEQGGLIFRTDEDGAIQYTFTDQGGTFLPFLHTIRGEVVK